MTLENLSNIPVSNSPATGLERIVNVDGFYPNFKSQSIQFFMTVLTKGINGVVMGYGSEVEPFAKVTQANNEGLVNPVTGQYVGLKSELSEEEQVGLIGEYDFFVAYAQSPIQLYPILYSKVLQADALGKLNRP